MQASVEPSPPSGPGARVLVIGPRRSGTTWTWLMLLRTEATFGLSEPDTAVVNPHAVRVLDYDECPMIEPGDDVPAGVVALWDGAFNLLPRERPLPARAAARLSWWCWDRVSEERRRETIWDGKPPPPLMRVGVRVAQPWFGRFGRRNRVVKSVLAMFAAEWIAERYQPPWSSSAVTRSRRSRAASA